MIGKRDFATFTDEVCYWLIKFGLFDYETRISTTTDADVRGTCTTYSNNVDRVCDICVQKEWNHPEHEDICRVAFHEVCELLIRELYNVGADFVSEKVLATELHRIIRRLENSYFVEEYSRRIKGGIKNYGNETRRTIFAARDRGSKVALVCVDSLARSEDGHASHLRRRST